MQVGMVMRWVLELQLFPHFKLEQSQVDNFMLELAKTIIRLHHLLTCLPSGIPLSCID